MAEREREGKAEVRWYQSNLGAGIVSGVAVVGIVALSTAAGSAAKNVPLGILLPLLGVAVVGAALAIPPSRRALIRASRFVWSLRPTTARRYAQAKKRFADGLDSLRRDYASDIDNLKAMHSEEIGWLRTEAQTKAEQNQAANSAVARQHQEDLAHEHDLTMRAAKALVDSEREVKRLTHFAKEEFRRGRGAGHNDARFGEGWEDKTEEELEAIRAEQRKRDAQLAALKDKASRPDPTAAIRALGLHRVGGPLPDPRWRLFPPNSSSGTYELRNLVPRSVAYGVRVESDEDEFLINDSGYWADLHGGSTGTFDGELTPHGRTYGATLWLSWQDMDGKDQRRDLKVPATKSPPAIRFDVSGDTPF